MVKNKYSIDDIKKRCATSTLNCHVAFDYQDYIIDFWVYKDPIKETRNIYAEITRSTDELVSLNFCTIDDLFEQLIVDGKALKEIWNDVKIVEISEFSIRNKHKSDNPGTVHKIATWGKNLFK